VDLFRPLRWLQPVVELARLGCFSLFVAVACWHWRAIAARAPDRVVRFRAGAVLAFVVLVSLIVGFTQIEAWPFTNWSLVHTYRSRSMTSWELEGVDAGGRGSEIDPRVLQPLQPEEFGAWMLTHITTLQPADRDALMRDLLDRANADRARFLAGRFPRNDVFLGPLSAPAHFAMRRVWRTPADVPSRPYFGVRLWRFKWDIERRDRDPSAFRRELLAEWPPR